jgi:hypothetical protein
MSNDQGMSDVQWSEPIFMDGSRGRRAARSGVRALPARRWSGQSPAGRPEMIYDFPNLI